MVRKAFDLKNLTQSLTDEEMTLKNYSEKYGISPSTLSRKLKASNLIYDKKIKQWLPGSGKNDINNVILEINSMVPTNSIKNTEDLQPTNQAPFHVDVDKLNNEIFGLKRLIEIQNSKLKSLETNDFFYNLKKRFNYKLERKDIVSFSTRLPIKVNIKLREIFESEGISTAEGTFLIMRSFIDDYEKT